MSEKNDERLNQSSGKFMVGVLLVLLAGTAFFTINPPDKVIPEDTNQCVVDVLSLAQKGLIISQDNDKVTPDTKYSTGLSLAEKMCAKGDDIEVSGKLDRKTVS